MSLKVCLISRLQLQRHLVPRYKLHIPKLQPTLTSVIQTPQKNFESSTSVKVKGENLNKDRSKCDIQQFREQDQEHGDLERSRSKFNHRRKKQRGK